MQRQPDRSLPQARMHLLNGALLALAALLVYASLAQEVTYGDGDQLLNYMLGGNLAYWTHFFYLPLLAGVTPIRSR
jgi:hypothetical protein